MFSRCCWLITRSSINHIVVLTVLIVSRLLSRVSILTRDIDIAILSVCLSVRHVPVLDENASTYCHSFYTIR